MSLEIERKFLVCGDQWHKDIEGSFYRQGYLMTSVTCAVRVRITDNQSFLTIKGLHETLITRYEYEYPIPRTDAEEILDKFCQGPLVEKMRYCVPYNGLIWEIDVFAGANQGLIIAEVELEDEDQFLNLPVWVGREVSMNPAYLNANLVQNPYTQWSEAEKQK